MVDTIHLWFPYQEIEGYEGRVEDVSSKLERVTTSSRANGFKTNFGHLENLRVSVNERGIKIQGSMVKFLFKNNFRLLERNDVTMFIDTLNEALNINAGPGRITRLDFGRNINCKYPPKTYTRLFTESRYYERHVHPNSVHYRNGNRQFIMYDKIIQAKKDGDIIPNEFKNKPLLRLEARLMNSARIKKDLNGVNRLMNLQKEKTWNTLPKVWEDMYFHFNTEIGISFAPAKIKSPKDMDNWYKAEGIKSNGGLAGVQQRIDILKGADSFKHQAYYSNMKRKYRSLIKRLSEGQENPFINELNSKVKEAVWPNLPSPNME